MRIRSVVSSEESCDETKAVTLNQASPGAEEVQWTWKRDPLQMRKAIPVLYSRRVIIEEITEELKLISDGVYQELVNSCFGFLMRFDTQGVACNDALHFLFTREVIKADAGPDELWYRVGGRFIRFSKYEYALVTGLSFRSSTFDPSAEHDPPATGLFLRHYGGRNLTMGALRFDFTAGVFRESPSDALKVAKLLIVYFLLFGLDVRTKYIDKWAWTLIEDSDGWETFMWGKYSYQILLTYLERVPTVLRHSRRRSYRVHGFVWAFLIWAFEAIPALRITCEVHASNDVLPRCLRWRISKINRVDMEGLCDPQMEVYSMLEPSAEEQRQPYWEHITDDLRSNVCYIHQKKKKTTPVNPPSRNVLPVSKKKAFYTQISHSKKKCKKTDLLTTRTSLRVVDQEKAPVSRPQHSLTTRGSPDLSEHEREEFLSQMPELSNVTVGQTGRNTSVFKLMDKINVLKNKKNMETEPLIMKMSQEMEELRQEKLEAGQVVKELEHENLKANKIIDELRLEKTESEKVAGLYKSKLKKLSPRIEGVGDLDFPNDADNLDSPSPGVRLTNNSSVLSKKGDRNLAESCWTREDDAYKTFVTSSGSQSGAHASGTRLMSDKILAEILKIARSSSTSAGGDTEILDSDDDNSISDSDKILAEILKIARSSSTFAGGDTEILDNDDDESISDLRMDDIKKNSQMKCDELEKTITLLMEEKNQRDEKIVELENKNAESERLVGVYFEKCESLDIEIVKMGKEIERLRSDNVEATKTMEELRLKKFESDQVAEGYKNRIDMLSPRIAKIEKDLSDMLNANSQKVSCCSGGRSSGLSMRGMKGKGWGVQMCSGRFSKIEQPSSAAADGDIVEISDDEEELNPDGAADVANVGESEMNIVQSSSIGQRSKRNRMDDGLNDNSVSTDLEDSCTDSRINNLIASLGDKK